MRLGDFISSAGKTKGCICFLGNEMVNFLIFCTRRGLYLMSGERVKSRSSSAGRLFLLSSTMMTFAGIDLQTFPPPAVTETPWWNTGIGSVFVCSWKVDPLRLFLVPLWGDLDSNFCNRREPVRGILSCWQTFAVWCVTFNRNTRNAERELKLVISTNLIDHLLQSKLRYYSRRAGGVMLRPPIAGLSHRVAILGK